MQICRRVYIKVLSAAIIFIAGTGLIFAQSLEMPSMPTAPSVTMPEMTTISAPTMDGKFYKPSIPQQYKKKPLDTNGTTSETKATESVLSDATTPDEILKSLITNSNLLSTSDISGLYDTGSFDTISSLSGLSGLTSTGKNSSEISTNLLLREILDKLNELKIEQNTAGAAQQEIYAAKIQDSETFRTRKPSVLRFKINNYSLKDSLTETFFSEPEPDGSFLFTADRKYFVNKKNYSETFYMLFKAIKSNGSTTTFSVTPSIAQGIENKDSYIYKLCQCKDIIAEKTGNLVVIHYVGDEVSTDLLLDIDK